MPTIALLDLPGLRARESAEPGFATALQAVADSLHLEASYLGAVMALESRFDPAARNPSGGATGLIQFMPATAALLGTTTDALRKMSAIQQLEYVLEYYTRAGRAIRPSVPGDYYMATFMPAHVGKPASFVLAVAGQPVYDQNRGLDVNKDGTLTVGDVTAKIDGIVAAARAKPLAEFEEKKSPTSEAVLSAAATLLPRLPPLRSQASSFGRPSEPAPAADADAALRPLVVFTAACELTNMDRLVSVGDLAGVRARVNEYWAAVLRQPFAGPYPKAWCGAFALWALHQAGLGLDLRWRFESTTDKRSGFLYALAKTKAPKPGDIAYLDQPWQHHAIVSAVDGDTVHTIDGNQGPLSPVKAHEAPLKHWTGFYSIGALLRPKAVA